MTNQDRKTLAEALFAVAVENQSQKESRLATLEAEMRKLVDAVAPVRDWYEGEDAGARPMPEILSEIVEDLQDDRRVLIETEGKYRTLEAENAKLRAESREFRGMDASVGITDPCPSCGQAKLFVGSGGHLTCSGSKCRNPCAIGDVAKENAKLRDLLRGEEAVAEECARIAERAMDGIVGAEIAMNIRSRFGGKA